MNADLAATAATQPVRSTAPARLARAIDLALETVASLLLLATVTIALVQVFWRYVLNDSLSWPEEMAKFLFVWFVFLGAAMVTHRSRHITIDILQRSLNRAALRGHAFVSRVISSSVAVFLVVFGWELVRRSTYVSPALEWPYTYLYLAVPAGAALSLVLLAIEPVAGFERAFSGLLATLCGAALYAAVEACSGSAWFASLGVVWPLIILSIGLMLLGLPIVDSLIFGTFVAFAPGGELALMPVPQGLTNSLDYLLLAIPFFMLAAGLMNVGGVTERLISLASTFVGHFRGGLGHVNVVTNTLMGGVSGSSTADAAAIAKTMVPAMARRGYPKPFGVALTSAASILANMIPPSLGLIIYGALSTVSVGALFVATIVPGILMAVAMSLVVHFECVRLGVGERGPKASWTDRRHAIRAALPALVLPALIVGGIRYGVFSATEAGAVAALYSLICGTLIYRLADRRSLLQALREAVSETATIMIVIAASAPFAFALIIEQVPQKLMQTLSVFQSNWIVLLLVLNAFLLFVGLAMEMIASMVILVPLLIPLLKAANIDLVHFGVIMVANLCIGALTPPLAVLVFTAARVTDTPIHLAYRACRPFMAGLLVWLAVISLVPALSLWPVKLFGP
ncbi:MAG TPA: TRAP transporter large permease subunit [Pseudorhodoplanes sp.]|jgi:C4-dicarboxylate transporter DctM subunit|nr:TRAP transporter large permease subunit [Pseudorhodoplanes sp.]